MNTCFIYRISLFSDQNISKTQSLRIFVSVCQGFMQDKIIASHTCFGGHMDVNC